MMTSRLAESVVSVTPTKCEQLLYTYCKAVGAVEQGGHPILPPLVRLHEPLDKSWDVQLHWGSNN